MPDLNFYNELRNKYAKDFPRQFWDWLIRQEISRPWWAKLGDPLTERNLLNQYYRQYTASTKTTELTGEEASKQIQSKVVTHPTEGDVIPSEGNEYLRPQLESLGWILKTDEFGRSYFKKPSGEPTKPEEPTFEYGGRKYTAMELGILAPLFGLQEEQRQFNITQRLKQREQQQALALQQEARQAEIARLRAFQMQASLRSPWENLGKTPNQGALDFETMREHLIESVRPESRNWISQYVKNVANPFAGQSQGRSDEDYAMLQDEAKRTKIAADRVRARLGDPNDALTMAKVLNPEDLEEQMAAVVLNAEKTVNDRLMSMEAERARGILAAQTGGGEPSGGQAQQAYWATPRATATGNYVVGREGGGVNQPPLTPEIPDWLQRASGLAGRVPEKRFASEIQRPSGQSWMQMTPTQQSQYAGLVDWAGTQSFEDIMAETARQLPQTPRVPRSWRAFSQV